jgi:hypothetical protein
MHTGQSNWYELIKTYTHGCLPKHAEFYRRYNIIEYSLDG